MQIREYQRWLTEFDARRGWDKVHPGHSLLHALEELGEVARHVLTLEGYRGADLEAARRALAGELADCMTFLFKLAVQYGIDMEDALRGNQEKVEARFSVEAGRLDMERYLMRQEENHRRLKGDA